LHEQHALPYLRETLVFLALAGILIPLLQRRRVNQVLGFLAAGALVGPFGLGLWSGDFPWLGYITFSSTDDIAPLAELGVLFLMFMIGLELSTERLWALRRWVFGGGTTQVVFSALMIGGIAYLFGNTLNTALVLGLVLALSSTAVVMQLMNERRAPGSPLGEAAFSVLMLQDLAVVPIFILLGVLAMGTSDNLLPLIGLTLAKSAGAVIVIYLLGRRVVGPAFRAFVGQRRPDVFMALTLLSVLGIGALTAVAGLSMALGALLAGLLLAETEFRHEVEVAIEPFKGLLMGLFFMSVGMQIDVREIARAPVLIPLSVVGLFLIKAAVLVVIFRIAGFNWGRAVEGGLLLGQGGEFAFIVIGYALATGLLQPVVAQFMLLVVGLSMFATPVVAKAGSAFGDWWQRTYAAHPASIDGGNPQPAEGLVIIAGFGRVGQLLARVLEGQGIPYVAFENNAALVAELNKKGTTVYFGDVARAELLDKVHARHAAAIVLTMDHPASVLHAVKAIRRQYPLIPLFARSRDEAHAVALMAAGATQVTPETLEAGLPLSASVLQTTGVAEEMVARVVQIERERRLEAMQPGAREVTQR
jgi:CPA2 family monovalent cation:H+ antiporter-2